jgi:histidine kinase
VRRNCTDGLITLSPYAWSSGAGISHMVQDIAKIEAALNKGKDLYKSLFDHVPCYVTVQDREFRLIRYNLEFEKKFSPQPGQHCYTAYKGRSQRCEICPVKRTFEDGAPHSSEEVGIDKDGNLSSWLVKTSPIKNDAGEIIAAMEMCLDITHKRELEEEVRKSEEKYRLIFDGIPNPVFVLDIGTLNILDCNESVLFVYGFSKNELIGKSFLSFFDAADRMFYDSEVKSYNIVNRAKQVRKDGESIYVNIRISSSVYLGIGVLLVTTSDITSRLMAEQQLIQAGKMAMLGEMATGVAHELNQPLTVIKTASSFLGKKVERREAIDEETLGVLVKEIESYSDRASKIINHMREFGRKSEVRGEKVNVNDPVRKALDFFGQQLRLREIELRTDLEENIPYIFADSNRLEQVFVNILINARDAIEEKTRTKDHRMKDKKIFLKTFSKGDIVFIEIEDTGTGVERAAANKIFEPFFTTKGVGKGTGLGLSISYSIIKDFEGSISIETEEGAGSKFIIQFPVLKD